MSYPSHMVLKNGQVVKMGIYFKSVNSKQKLNNFRNQKLNYYSRQLNTNINKLKSLAKVKNTNNNINMLAKIRTYYKNKKKVPGFKRKYYNPNGGSLHSK